MEYCLLIFRPLCLRHSSNTVWMRVHSADVVTTTLVTKAPNAITPINLHVRTEAMEVKRSPFNMFFQCFFPRSIPSHDTVPHPRSCHLLMQTNDDYSDVVGTRYGSLHGYLSTRRVLMLRVM